MSMDKIKKMLWCLDCGEEKDKCTCGAPKGYTNKIHVAYKIWLGRKREETKK